MRAPLLATLILTVATPAVIFAAAGPQPIVTYEVGDVIPSQGPSDTEATIYIRGTFRTSATVTLDSAAPLPVSFVDDTLDPDLTYDVETLIVTLPAGLSEGPHTLTVDDFDDASPEPEVLIDAYTVIADPPPFPGPILTSIRVQGRTFPSIPTVYGTLPGDVLEVRGLNFQDGATVDFITFDGVEHSATTTFIDDTHIQVDVPELDNGNYVMRLTNPDDLSDAFPIPVLVGYPEYSNPGNADCLCAIRSEPSSDPPAPWPLALGFVVGLIATRRSSR